ncbi:MAG TPA: heparan-alpha-glucosaminide N-acetyltransferase domain-containing protein [Steroidobacteraceae bacterium]|nr:heparan-alpha-glucosaminide N-acetyltransferase domain-containing protein [Steroidobacteraceae bacterium]
MSAFVPVPVSASAEPWTVPATGARADERAYRLTSIDMLRGLVIVVMALDHVRDYFLADLDPNFMDDPAVSPALFFTRWITHLCAPVFVFLAGTSAGLMVLRKTPAQLAGFLATRGLWLILVEWFVISTAFSFAPLGSPGLGGRTLVVLQVIWAIGASMLVLALCQFLGRRVCLALGAVIVIGHNALDAVWPSPDSFAPAATPLWVVLHARLREPLGPLFVVFSYPVLPWIGVMLCGFGSSALFELPARRRQGALLLAGIAMILGFLLLRAFDVYGDPNHWREQPGSALRTALDFLNVTKYPPSLDYLLATLGPAAIVCALAERWSGGLKDRLVLLGRVPFAFYVAHFYLIHALAVMLGAWQGFPAADFFDMYYFFPKGYGLPLWGVYVVWALVIALLYPWARWVAGVKARSRAWWLSYL